jgi:hypothetical protein
LARLIHWATERGDVQVQYGRGAKYGTVQFKLYRDGAALSALMISLGKIYVPFDFMGSQAPFGDSRDARDELRRRINEAVPAAAIPAEEERLNPSFDLTALADERNRDAFLKAIEWAFDEAHRAQTLAPT